MNTALYNTCTYDRLTEDEHSVLKHVEDIKKLEIKIKRLT
jgi:hypothetical protein